MAIQQAVAKLSKKTRPSNLNNHGTARDAKNSRDNDRHNVAELRFRRTKRITDATNNPRAIAGQANTERIVSATSGVRYGPLANIIACEVA